MAKMYKLCKTYREFKKILRKYYAKIEPPHLWKGKTPHTQYNNYRRFWGSDSLEFRATTLEALNDPLLIKDSLKKVRIYTDNGIKEVDDNLKIIREEVLARLNESFCEDDEVVLIAGLAITNLDYFYLYENLKTGKYYYSSCVGSLEEGARSALNYIIKQKGK